MERRGRGEEACPAPRLRPPSPPFVWAASGPRAVKETADAVCMFPPVGAGRRAKEDGLGGGVTGGCMEPSINDLLAGGGHVGT